MLSTHGYAEPVLKNQESESTSSAPLVGDLDAMGPRQRQKDDIELLSLERVDRADAQPLPPIRCALPSVPNSRSSHLARLGQSICLHPSQNQVALRCIERDHSDAQ